MLRMHNPDSFAERVSFQECVTRFEKPTQHYQLLVTQDGEFVGFDDAGNRTVSRVADDNAMWECMATGVYQHVCSGNRHNVDTSNPQPTISVERGPEKLPSYYLDFLQRNGWVCLTSILPPSLVDDMQRVACTDGYADLEFDRETPVLAQSPAIARTAAEPVSLWLVRQYLKTDDIVCAHAPGLAILGKDDSERMVQGWHTDYPYHWGVPAQGQVPVATGMAGLGVQRNVCVSDFTKMGGATAFKLGSHVQDCSPPEDWGTATAHAQPGYRSAHGLPYNGADADIVEAPGGSIILYDSRTWHRAGINRTDNKRAALLQAMIPMYILPKSDTSSAYKAFVASMGYQGLNQREKIEVRNLLLHRFIGPGNRHAIAGDAELTNIYRDQRRSEQA